MRRAWEDMLAGKKVDLRRIDGFLKREMVDAGKAVHLIGSRNLHHRVWFGRYIAALESKLYKLPEFLPLRSDSYACGERLHAVLQGSVRILETDHTAWDAHMSAPLLRLVHEFYQKVFPHDPVLLECLSAQLENVWRFRNGVSYVLYGTRTSGDSDTSCGNSLLHVAINRYLARRHGCEIDQVVKGDDSVISFKSSRVFPVEDYAALFGFEVKPVWRDDPAEVEFASSILLPVLRGEESVWKMFRLPRKIITRLPFSLGLFTPRMAQDRFADKVVCEQFCTRGCPVVAAFVDCLLRSTRTGAKFATLDSTERRRIELFRGDNSPVQPEARRIFAIKFGIGIDEQLACESYLAALPSGCVIQHPVLSLLGA